MLTRHMMNPRTATGSWLTRLGLATMTAWVGLSSLGCEQGPSTGTGTRPSEVKTLRVLTPHNERIRDTFGAGFSSWYYENYDSGRVRIEWIYRGTPECVAYVLDGGDEVRAAGEKHADVLFGGGGADHQLISEAGWTEPILLGDLFDRIPEKVGSVPTRDPNARWIATGLSTFGILYHAQACERRGIEPPTTWSDLADPRFYGWLAVADPRRSGSHRESLGLVVESSGMEAGWGLVMRILGNSRSLSPRSSTALSDVEDGVMLATFAVNFDGAARIEGSDDTLAYVDPPGATLATPSAMSVLSLATEPDLAQAFARFVMSRGQALWAVNAEELSTAGQTLYHYPIDAGIYEDYTPEQRSVKRNPIAEPFGADLDPQALADRGPLLRILIVAACHDGNHIKLQRLWKRIIDAGMPEAAVREFGRLPFEDAELEAAMSEIKGNPRMSQRVIMDLAERFSAHYDAVSALLGS